MYYYVLDFKYLDLCKSLDYFIYSDFLIKSLHVELNNSQINETDIYKQVSKKKSWRDTNMYELFPLSCQVSASQKLLNGIIRSMMASSTGDGTLQSLRQKRWDYQTDGCHCGVSLLSKLRP